MSFSSVSGGPLITDNLILSGGSSSGSATITSDASGDIILTPVSGAVCNVGGVEIYSSGGSQYIQSSGFSNLNIGNGEENGIAITSTGFITLNSLSVNASTLPTISTTTDASDLYIGGSTTGNTTCSNIGICATNEISLNFLQVNADGSPTIQPAFSSDSLTLSGSTLNFTPSAGYLRMSQTPYFTGGGTGAPQSFTLPCGGVFLMTMVANATPGDQVSIPSLSDMWFVFSTSASNTISPYSTSNEPVSGYFVGVNANGVIGVQSSSTSNTIGVAVYQNDGYFYNFYLTMIS